MLRWWGARAPAGPAATVPPGVRVYAVGDVHGRLDLLEELLAAIRRDGMARPPAETRLVMLGDLVDRGPASADVVELFVRGVAGFDQVDVIMGNHEELLLRLLDLAEPPLLAQYLRIGGLQTLESYGVPERLLALPELYPPAALLDHVPAAHRAWLRGLADSVRIGDYLFVHAGIRPGVPLDQQEPADLRWIRQPFLDSVADHGAVVVHGHTVARAPTLRANRIGLDTGAFASGVLTALALEGGERRLLATAARPVADA